VKKAGQAERIDVFNARYGLFRGLVAGLCVIWVAAIQQHFCQTPPVYLGYIITIGLALFRMQRFGFHYARELFVQFLNIDPGKESASEKTQSL
jgi:hypothetical protein